MTDTKRQVVKKSPTKEKVHITDIVPKTDNGKKLSLVPTWVQSKQIMAMLQRTPPQHIYKRKAKGGGHTNFSPPRL